MANAWELISSERRGLVGRRQLVAKTFRVPDAREATFLVVGDATSRAVACVAVTARQTVVIAEQYRPGPERVMAELPGGAVDPNESLIEGAARELAEETGYVAQELTYLGEMCYDAYSGIVRHYFLATGCECRQEQELDPNEFVTVREVTLAEAVTLAMTAQMTDPGAILLALPHLTGDQAVLELLTARRVRAAPAGE